MIAPPGQTSAPTGQTSAPASTRPDSVDAPLAGNRAAQWRRWRLPLGLVAFVIAGGIVIALIAPPARPNGYLDPASKASDGTRALAAILAEQDHRLTLAYSPAQALGAIGQAGSGSPSATLVVTSPDLLSSSQRRQIARVRADLVLVEPGAASLADLAPPVRVASMAAPSGVPLAPACALPAARLAGTADVGSITYRAPAQAVRCYPAAGYPSLVSYSSSGRTITILGSGAPLSDGWLAAEGNAALCLDLLSAHKLIVWLTPEPALALGGPPAGTGNGGPPLIPWAAWLVVFQLCLATVLAAIWRARRFGPLIAEPLPVVVRASETVEGHARLYQARRARGRAAAELRQAMLRRVRPALGLGPDAPAETVAGALATRSALSATDVTSIVSGPDPASDEELVRLARSLDELEKEVRAP